ncbi:MAG: hypothetical protein Q8S84_06240 [bacterium]|nr:hypothetical protein [bacterium]MDP3381073.1 hypothetical protein [bacterium]
MFSNFSFMYGGRGILHSFSTISKNSIHHLSNTTILPESDISFIVADIIGTPHNSSCRPPLNSPLPATSPVFSGVDWTRVRGDEATFK